MLKVLFSPVRLISDNILLADELLHTFGQKKSGRNGLMDLKLDLSKAYDKVEWHFLSEIMKKIGFDMVWINRIMSCVSMISYSILLNERVRPSFRPTRGLR